MAWRCRHGISVVGLGANDRAIGNGNQLLWHVPDDLKRFSSLTRHKPVVMGRKTYESIIQINGGPLRNRENFVVTRDLNYAHTGAIVTHSIDQALKKASEFDSDEIHIGGGVELYSVLLPQVDKLFLTYFHYKKPSDEFSHLSKQNLVRQNDMEFEIIIAWITNGSTTPETNSNVALDCEKPVHIQTVGDLRQARACH